ncbi:2568_t:CDS:2, partial [Cetraspora pellucida]
QNSFEPGYIYQSEALQNDICKSSSEVTTSVYQKAFFTKTRLDGLEVFVSFFVLGTRSFNPEKDQALLKQLNEYEYLRTFPENEISANQFWNAFQDALDSNIRGVDGKRHILSIIANKLSYEAIKKIYLL